jgi:hypothetical protein
MFAMQLTVMYVVFVHFTKSFSKMGLKFNVLMYACCWHGHPELGGWWVGGGAGVWGAQCTSFCWTADCAREGCALRCCFTFSDLWLLHEIENNKVSPSSVFPGCALLKRISIHCR